MSGRPIVLVTAIFVTLAAIVAACGPAAEPTATSAPRATATTAPAATATKPAEVKNRPLAVLSSPPPNPQAQKGGVFRTLSSEDPPDFGIWDSAVGSTFEVAIPVTDTLFDRNEFQPGKMEELLPNLAYDWWTDATGEKWTFKLREGAKFHDGAPFTCADVKFSLEVIRDARDATGSKLRRSPRGAWLGRVKDIRCPDASTVEIVTNGPLPSIPATLAVSSFAIMPKHIFEGKLELLIKQASPGVGAFMFESHTTTESVKLKRNPNYWNQPYPYLDGVWVVNVGSNTAMQSAMRVGRAELGSSSGLFTAGLREQLIAEGKIVVPRKEARDGFNGWQANWTRKPWSDPRFSLAMRCAIDSKKVIETAENGQTFEGPIFPLAETPGGSPWAVTKAEWMAVHPCHGPSGDAANMEKRRQIARDLLKDMGFTAENPAQPTSYTVGNDQVFIAVLNDLAQVGINVKFRSVTTNERYNIQTNGETDILQQGFATSRRDPDHWLYEQYYSTSDRNYGKYTNPEIDVLIDKQSRTLDVVERKKTINQIEKMLLRDNAKIVVRHSLTAPEFASWVKDVYWGEPGNSQNTSVKRARIWIDQAKMKQVLG